MIILISQNDALFFQKDIHFCERIFYALIMSARKKKVSTSEQILVAAKALFAEKGFGETSVKEISDKAGVNISAVSYHFGGKEELFAVILNSFAEEGLKPAFRPLEKPPVDMKEFKLRLELFAHNLFDYAKKDRCAFVICVKDHDALHELQNQVYEKTFASIFESIVGFFAGAQKNGIIRENLNPEFVAKIILHSIKMEVVDNTEVDGVPFVQDDMRIRIWTQSLLNLVISGIKQEA